MRVLGFSRVHRAVDRSNGSLGFSATLDCVLFNLNTSFAYDTGEEAP